VLLASVHAQAGGLYFTDRGVRPMGRGGAFVAGADDLGAIVYNPAGLVYARRQFLADMAWLLFHSEYSRAARIRQVDPNTGEPTGQQWDETLPTTEGSAQLIPIPTLAVSYDFGVPNTTFALGMYAPYAVAARYNAAVDGKPNPGRYMLLNLEGSVLVVPGIWAAHQPDPHISLGIGFQMLVGEYRSETVMNACLPERFNCATEAHDYDGVTKLNVGPLFAPGGNIGIIVEPDPHVRIGASYQLPFFVDAPATVQVRIPRAAVFKNAQQQGDKARVQMDFPWIGRVGVEARNDWLRGELAYVYEAWGMHDEIKISTDNIVLRDVVFLPDEYRITDQTIVRNFRDTWSLRLGGEATWEIEGYKLDTRAGVMYEKSAVPKEYLTTLSIDLDKVIVGIGGSLHVGNTWRFDALIARTFTATETVSTGEAKVPLLNPVRSNPPEFEDYVNAGEYRATATVLGVGMAVNL
jgi:long-chain fatty acid transport protein